MTEISRRHLLVPLAGAVVAGATAARAATLDSPTRDTPGRIAVPRLRREITAADGSGWAAPGSGWTRFEAMCEAFCSELDYQIDPSWVRALEFESFDGTVLTVSTLAKFLKNWIAQYHADALLRAARSAFGAVESVDLVLRPNDGTIQRNDSRSA